MRMDFYEIAERNKWRTIALILVFIIFVGGLGYLVDRVYMRSAFPFITLMAITISGIQSLIAYFIGDKIVLKSVHARPINPRNLKEVQLKDVVEELSLAAGIPVPKIYVMEDPSPNAFATGRDPEHASVCATTGLLKIMNREELMGVMGHELTHIRSRDILTMTVISALAGAIGIMASMLRYTLYYMHRNKWRYEDEDDDRLGSNIWFNLGLYLLLIVLIVLAPLIARIMALAVSRAREYAADAGSAELTRNPLALASALRKIAGAPPMEHANHGVAHLFIADPFKSSLSEKDSLWADMFSTHPPIWKRIRILEQMAGKYV